MIIDDGASICKALYDFLDDFDEFDLRRVPSAEGALAELEHQAPGRGYGAGVYGILFHRHTQPQGPHARGVRPGRRHAVHRGIARDGSRSRIRFRRVPGWMSAGTSVANSGRSEVR